MEWDAIGTFAMFLAQGAVGVGVLVLLGYRMKLKSQLEQERLKQTTAGAADELRRAMHELLAQQQSQLDELHERLDFTERMLTSGRPADKKQRPQSTPT